VTRLPAFSGIILATALLASPESGTARVFVEREAYLMGTRVRLAAWDAGRDQGLGRLERGLRALEQAEAELSPWRADSAITALNRTPVGSPWHARGEVCDAIAVLFEWHRKSGGAFDPAIGTLLDVWDIHGAGRIPTERELSDAMRAGGLRRFDFDRVRCRVTRRADARIDVGAWGKGEALDRAARAMGEGAWLIDLGGQVAVGAPPPDKAGWLMAVAHPQRRDHPQLKVRIRGGSLSTSGGSERDVMIGGQRVGHIFDPRTGRPAPFRGSVTVWHQRGLVADILSTALFVMGPEAGLAWADAHGVGACFLTADAQGSVRVQATAAFRKAVLFSEE
jgi:thiamine biosynthesis lipoprotein